MSWQEKIGGTLLIKDEELDEPVVYTPTTALEKIQAANLSYIFGQAVKYRELSEEQEAEITALKARLAALNRLKAALGDKL